MALGDLIDGAVYAATANALTHPPVGSPVVKPTAPTVGNSLFLCVNSSSIIQTPAGYALDDATNGFVTANNDMRIFRRTVQAGDTATMPTVTLNASRPCTIDWFEREGVATLDSSATKKTYAGAAVGALTTNAITTIAAAVVMIAMISPEVNAVRTMSAWLSTFVESSDQTPSGGTAIYGAAVATRQVAAQGTYSTGATIDGTLTTPNYDALLLAYTFAVGGGGGGGGGPSSAQFVGVRN